MKSLDEHKNPSVEIPTETSAYVETEVEASSVRSPSVGAKIIQDESTYVQTSSRVESLRVADLPIEKIEVVASTSSIQKCNPRTPKSKFKQFGICMVKC